MIETTPEALNELNDIIQNFICESGKEKQQKLSKILL